MAGHRRESMEVFLIECKTFFPGVVIVGFVCLAMAADADVMHGLISFAKITPVGNHPNHINRCWVTRL